MRFCLRNMSYLNLEEKITWTIIDSWLCFILTASEMNVFTKWSKFMLNSIIQASMKIFPTMIKSIHHSLFTLSNSLLHFSHFTTLNLLFVISSLLILLLIWTQTSTFFSITGLTISMSLPTKMSYHYILPND